MQQQIRTKPVRLTAANPVELEPGITLAAGNHRGTSKETGVRMMQGMSWTRPQYYIEFSAEQLEDMGAKNLGDTISEEWDVTKFVGSGQIVVS